MNRYNWNINISNIKYWVSNELQVQGLLNVTRRKSCYFVVYVDDEKPLFIQKIDRDENFWKTIMLPGLKTFYMGCFLPEVLQHSIHRGIECDYIPPVSVYLFCILLFVFINLDCFWNFASKAVKNYNFKDLCILLLTFWRTNTTYNF